jgi:hypothetical protein
MSGTFGEFWVHDEEGMPPLPWGACLLRFGLKDESYDQGGLPLPNRSSDSLLRNTDLAGAPYMKGKTMKRLQRWGGIAALYGAIAYIAAIPYFLIVVDYPSVVDPLKKVILLKDNYMSMYAMHVIVYEFFGIGLIVLGLALYQRLRVDAPVLAPIGAALALVWACLLLGSSMVFNYGMGAVVELYDTDPAQAVRMWQTIETIALGLGGSGGELLGGLWLLAVSWAAIQTDALPRALNWLGLVIAAAGLISIAPQMRDVAIVFGLLQIVWFAWVGIVLLSRSELVPAQGHRHEQRDIGSSPSLVG